MTLSKRIMVLVILAATSLGPAQQASATHCDEGNVGSCPAPATVWVLEGIGFVCAEARGVTNPRCTYHTDELFSQLPPSIDQGLYWPGLGPAASGPFSFVAGPNLSMPTSLCVSSVDGPGCVFDSKGTLTPGTAGFGAYCGSSLGAGTTTFRSAAGSLTMKADFGWAQSAATILPLQGRITATTPAGGAGATLIGFVSSRGTSGGGNCGITSATTAFNVEGMILTF